MSGRPTARLVAGWADEVAVVGERIGRHFARSEPRGRAVGSIRGLLSGVDRKNGWQLAEHLGAPTPDGVPHLLARADWDADAVRDDLVAYVAERLGDPGVVLVVDETGFLKKGSKSCGVARQYTGTAGRVENAQVGVFLASASPKGRAPGRPGPVPAEGVDGRPGPVRRGRGAGGRQVRRQAAAGRGGAPPGLAGRGGGRVGGERRGVRERRGVPPVPGAGPAAVRPGRAADQRLWVDVTRLRGDAIAAGLPAGGWRRASAGAGSKGPR